MKIINLSQEQYRSYANSHNFRNFGQTIEYSMLNENIDKKKLFLGLVDSSNNIHAATLLLVSNVSKFINKAEAPDGYLIDYDNFELVKTFTFELKRYLLKEKITYLIINPKFKLSVRNKKNVIIEDNKNIYNNLLSLNYISLGYIDSFERYDVIIENNDSIHAIYNDFSRNTKRNINFAKKYGIELVKASKDNIDEAYNILKKKKTYNLSYYKSLFNIYNTSDNEAELFFTKINPNKYLIKCKEEFEKEELNNNKINLIFKNSKNKEKLLNKKINSDKTLDKRKEELNKAILLNQKTDKDVIIGTSIVIRNNHEIYFLIDGFNDSFRKIYSTHMLKWAVIKKYYSNGYRIFNLGEINDDYLNRFSKYKGLYDYKIGFGGNIVEYSPSLELIINKPLYSAYINLNKLTNKKKPL